MHMNMIINTLAVKIINKCNVIAVYRFKLQTMYKLQAMMILCVNLCLLFAKTAAVKIAITSVCNVRLLDHFHHVQYIATNLSHKLQDTYTTFYV